MNPTRTEYVQSVISGSFIMALLSALNKHDYNRGSIIRLRNRLSKVLAKGNKDLISVATEAYDAVKVTYVDEPIELDIGITIEAISENKKEYMKKVFGNDIDVLVSRASAKITLSGLTPKQGRDSYKISDELTKSIEKHTFSYIQGTE